MSYEGGARELAPDGPADQRLRPSDAAPDEEREKSSDGTRADQAEGLAWHGYGPLSKAELAEVATLKRELTTALIGTYIDRITGVDEACQVLCEPPPVKGLLFDMVLAALTACSSGLVGIAAAAGLKGVAVLGEKGRQVLTSAVAAPSGTLVSAGVKGIPANAPVSVSDLKIGLNDTIRAQQLEYETQLNAYLGELDVSTPTRDTLESLRSQVGVARTLRAQSACRQRVATLAEWAGRQTGPPMSADVLRGVLRLSVVAFGAHFFVTEASMEGISDDAKKTLRTSGLTLGDLMTEKHGMHVHLRLRSGDVITLSPSKRFPVLVNNNNEPAAMDELIFSYRQATLPRSQWWDSNRDVNVDGHRWLREVVWRYPLEMIGAIQ